MINKTILVTGGAGFIGSCFVRMILANHQDWQVINLDVLSYAATTVSVPAVASDRYRLIAGDINDRALVRQVLEQFNPQWLVNFAAESHVDRSIADPECFVMTNVVGTYRLLDSCFQWWKQQSEADRTIFRFLHVSTDEVYGSLGPDGYFTESSPYRPNSPYSASKASSDHFVRAYQHTYGLPTLTTNCSNNYGPYQFPEKLVPLTILHASDGKPLPVYGDGRNVRDWLFVEDHCLALLSVLQNGRIGEVYNIGGNSERTNLQVVHTICDTIDELVGELPPGSRRRLIQFVVDRPGHDRRYGIDISKIKNELGWCPRRSFEDGLRETVHWYIQNPDWLSETANRTVVAETPKSDASFKLPVATVAKQSQVT